MTIRSFCKSKNKLGASFDFLALSQMILAPVTDLTYVGRVLYLATGSPVCCANDETLEVRIAPRFAAMAVTRVEDPSFAVRRHPAHRLPFVAGIHSN